MARRIGLEGGARRSTRAGRSWLPSSTLYLAPGLDGLQTAEQNRALDPDIHIVLVSAQANIHPVDMSERVPPTDQMYFVKKQLYPVELQ